MPTNFGAPAAKGVQIASQNSSIFLKEKSKQFTQMKALKCSIYLLFSGIAYFIIGLLLPRKWFHFDQFPYRSRTWEKDGKLYDNIHIKRWKSKLPDMSRICPIMVPKKIAAAKAENIELLIYESCVAELIHVLLIPMGLGCIGIWKSGGVLFFLFWAIGNVPFILIQRYNRPILYRLYLKLRAKEGNTSPNVRCFYESFGFKL